MSSAFFPDSHHFVSNIGTVITATNYNQNGGSSERDWALELLRENISAGAMHNSDERCDAPACHPDTRKAVQEDIFSWMSHGDNGAEPKKLMWMSGPAGCGKTAIAGSVAEACEEAGWLAASFFCSSFSGSTSRRSKKYVIPTLAYQLMQVDRSGTLRKWILSSVRDDPAIFTKRLKDQCRVLLLDPLDQLVRQGLASSLPMIIIVDGLDEIERAGTRDTDRQKAIRGNEADQVEVLNALLTAVSHTNFPIRILIVSRPERGIREFFAEPLVDDVTIRLFLNNEYNPDADIELFLTSKFADIRRRYRGIPPSWPEGADIQTLVCNASGQFIYAATVIRFVQDGSKPPPDQLNCVLQLRPTNTENPFEMLDAVYAHILMSSPDPILAAAWIFNIGVTLFNHPAHYLRQLLETSAGQAEHLLGNLTSLVHIPAPDDTTSSYTIYHKSLWDYLADIERGRKAFQVPLVGPFLIERAYVRVLRGHLNLNADKGPALPLEPSERRGFFTHLTDVEEWTACIISAFDANGYTDHLFDNILAQCNVPWWMAITTTANRDEEESIVSTSFHYCHRRCVNDEGTPCRAACRSWRWGILSFCRQNGWTISREAEVAAATGYPSKIDIEVRSDDDDDDDMWRSKLRCPGLWYIYLLLQRMTTSLGYCTTELQLSLRLTGTITKYIHTL